MLNALITSLVLAGLLAQSPSDSVTVHLRPAEMSAIPRIMPKVIVIRPQSLNLTNEFPESLIKIPVNLKKPVFGSLKFGVAGVEKAIIIGVDESDDDKPPRILVDANTNGDLTDDPPLTPYKSRFVRNNGTTLTEYTVAPTIPMEYEDGAKSLLTLNIRWIDPADVRRSNGNHPILYYANYFTTGEIALGGHTYRIALSDTLAKGDFRGRPEGETSGIMLLMDINGNEAFDGKGESVDIRQPFNIKGTTYEVTSEDPSGQTLTITKSKKSVPEILPPPDLRVGKPVVPFEGATIGGKRINFPKDYHGVTLLYFWGSWCGDCKAEVPFMAKAWAQLKDKGLAFLGISLDFPNEGKQFTEFVKSNKLPPDQIYAGKHWSADIAVLYGVTSIPTAYLVNSITGKVIAGGDDLIGERLIPTLEKMLAHHNKDKKQ
ncbi:MAG: TlpA disulfide reductase family protein [Armatimonadetes bacterium]|nr:TlpA disulfide reductase family protein [Armatimonadota bacterium]